MSVTMRRRHAQPAETAEFSFTVPRGHLELVKDLAHDRGWSAGEVIRRALVLFFRTNMDITDHRYAVIDDPDTVNGDE